MASTDLVAVVATAARYRALTHQPSGTPLDAEGHGDWPADQFTFALIRDGALHRLPDEATSDAAKPGSTPAKKGA